MDASDSTMNLRWVGDRHLLVSLGARTSGGAACELVRGVRGVRGVIDVVPAEATALVTFDARELVHEAAMAEVRRALASPGAPATESSPRVVEVPVCYTEASGPDLAEVARLCGLTVERVIALHSGAEHVVRFLGFAPGFAYIAGLPRELAVPRLDSPRVRVPAGSVGIAGNRTGIYPREGPGGWRLIGRTPLRMFDAEREPAALLRAGDRVRFVPIGEDEFRDMGGR